MYIAFPIWEESENVKKTKTTQNIGFGSLHITDIIAFESDGLMISNGCNQYLTPVTVTG